MICVYRYKVEVGVDIKFSSILMFDLGLGVSTGVGIEVLSRLNCAITARLKTLKTCNIALALRSTAHVHLNHAMIHSGCIMTFPQKYKLTEGA